MYHHFSKSPEHVAHQGEVKKVEERAAPLCPGLDEVQDGAATIVFLEMRLSDTGGMISIVLPVPSSPLSPHGHAWEPACQSFSTEVISSRTERGSFLLIIVILLCASLGSMHGEEKMRHVFGAPRA